MIVDETFLDIQKSTVIGLKNIEKKDEENLKSEIDNIYSNVRYINLNEEILRNKTTSEEKGMISRKWIDNILNKYPSFSIFCYYVNEEQKNLINEKLSYNISFDIDNTLSKLYGDKSDYNKFIFVSVKVKNKNNISFVKTLLKEISSKYHLFIDEKFPFQTVINLIKSKSNEFFTEKINNYKKQLSNKETSEFIIKKNIKIGILCYIINDFKIFDFFESAYNLMIKLVHVKKYSLCNQDERMIFFEMKNICDWLIFNIFRNNGYNGEYIKNRLINHFSYFNFEDFISNENLSIEMRIIILFWKLRIYDYFSKLRNEFINDAFCNFEKIHSIMRLIKTYNLNKNYLDSLNIDPQINEMNSKYCEKLPIYILQEKKIEDVNLIIKIYYCNLIKQNILNYENLQTKVKNLIINGLSDLRSENEKYTFYFFKTASIMNIIEENKKNSLKFLKNILYGDKSLFLQNNFPKIFNDLLTKYNKLIKENEMENSRDNFLNIIKKSCFEKLSNEENTFLNNFFSNSNIEEIEKKNLKFFKLNPNEMFNIDFSFSNIHPKILDIITLNLEIKTYLDNSIKIPIKKIKVIGTKDNKQFINEENFELSNSNPFTKEFKMFTSKNDNELTIYSIDILLQNGILFSYSFKPYLNKTIILDQFDNKDIDKHIVINYQKDIQMGEFQYKYFKIDISNKLKERIKINEIKSSFKLIRRKSNENFDYEFFLKDENNNIINKKNEELNFDDIRMNEDNSEIIEFILKINTTGEFKLDFKIHFNLSSLEINNLSLEYDYENFFKILSVRPLNIKSTSDSSIIFGKDKNNIKIKPTFHPFKIQSILNNSIIEDVIIKNIEIYPFNSFINISSPITKLLEKNYEQIILSNTQFIIPFHVIVNEDFNGEIGYFQLKWTTKNLENYSNNLINETKFSFKDLKSEEECKKIDLKFSVEIINYICKISVENNSNEIKNIMINLELNKDNPDYLIEG